MLAKTNFKSEDNIEMLRRLIQLEFQTSNAFLQLLNFASVLNSKIVVRYNSCMGPSGSVTML